MAKLNWLTRDARTREYETGISHGVLFPSPVINSAGQVWNGLAGVDETHTGREYSPTTLDGLTVFNQSGYQDFKALLRAFSAPKDFGACVGETEVRTGIYVTNQGHAPFALSYRTRLGNSIADGHRIHILYNLTASTPSISNVSRGGGNTQAPLSWTITGVPVASSTIRPTAHIWVDTLKAKALKPAALATFMDQLYGSATGNSRLLSPAAVAAIFA